VSADLPLTPDDVAEIVAILDGSHFERLDIRTARFRLRVARDGEGWTQQWDWSDESSHPTAAAAAPATVEADENEPGVAVRAPLPGTFYRAPQPGAPPFVEVGDVVGPDTVIGIIETMKLMNPVHAGAAGTIAAIGVANAESVASGAVLMRIA
jgi:acetyl-CoA carboxylase biotin carboxyl carrier protein